MALCAIGRLCVGCSSGIASTPGDALAIAARVSTIPLRAAASLAAGRVALAEGQHEAAQRHCEDAVDGYLRSGAPFELAFARMELARALAAHGRAEDAVQEVRRAITALSELKAELAISRASELLASLERSGAPRTAGPHPSFGLTKREVEVLRRVAAGSSKAAGPGWGSRSAGRAVRRR
jgi:DNA-binding NarL/FixJ family response regulator